jgi:hypothetical protein
MSGKGSATEKGEEAGREVKVVGIEKVVILFF